MLGPGTSVLYKLNTCLITGSSWATVAMFEWHCLQDHLEHLLASLLVCACSRTL